MADRCRRFCDQSHPTNARWGHIWTMRRPRQHFNGWLLKLLSDNTCDMGSSLVLLKIEIVLLYGGNDDRVDYLVEVGFGVHSALDNYSCCFAVALLSSPNHHGAAKAPVIFWETVICVPLIHQSPHSNSIIAKIQTEPVQRSSVQSIRSHSECQLRCTLMQTFPASRYPTHRPLSKSDSCFAAYHIHILWQVGFYACPVSSDYR